jgi:hypothetical protein
VGKLRKFIQYTVAVLAIIIIVLPVGYQLTIRNRLSLAKNTWNQQISNSTSDSSDAYNKLALIIPGMDESPYEKVYRQIGECFRKQGIRPVYVFIDWRELDLTKLNIAGYKEIDLMLEKYPADKVYLFGYSMGAAIALNCTRNIKWEKMILCSPSPVFKEEIDSHPLLIKQAIRFFLKGAIDNLKYPSGDSRKMVFLYGAHDSLVISKKIINKRRKKFKGSRVIVIKGASHDMKRNYLQTIKSIIGELGNDNEKYNITQ